MKLIKSVLAWEAGLERVTPFGTLRFNHNCVCAINDDGLAQKVVDSSPSLIMADVSDEEAKELLGELKAADAIKNAPKDEVALGKFMANSANGVVAQADSLKTIGVPATEANMSGEEDNGSFEPLVKSTEDAPLVNLTKTESKGDKSKDTKVVNDMSTEDFAASLKGYKHAELKKLLIEGGVDLSKYSNEETKSKEGLIKIACEVKAKA